MPKFFVTTDNIENNKITITGKDVNHIKNVLRKKVGDKIIVCKNKDYLCKIVSLNNNIIECKIIQELDTNSESNIKVTIYQGLPKSDKMELIIQKSVELGVFEIVPTEMRRCVAKLKDKQKKIQRWQKISEVASKQCNRNIIPQINNVITLDKIDKNMHDIILVAYENEKKNTLKNELKEIKKTNYKDVNIAIVIGPEGGIDETEIEILKQKQAKIVTLGDRILRTETVALNMLSIIMYELEN